MAKAAALPIEDQDELTIPATAQSALKEADGDVIRATEIMVAKVLKDPKLYRPLMDPLVKTACYDVITAQCRQQRRAIWSTKQPTADEQRGQVVALSQGTAATLLDFPLPGGMRLRDARRDDVTAGADFYANQANDMGVKAKWLRLIAQHVTGKKTVSQVMTDERLSELREEASHD